MSDTERTAPETEENISEAESTIYRKLLVFVAIPAMILLLALPLIWNIGQQKAGTSAVSAQEALASSLTSDKLGAAATAAGHAATGDEVCTILMLATSSTGELSRAGLIALNTTENFAKLITLDSTLTTSNNSTLAELYEAESASGVVDEISQTGLVAIDHLALMNEDGFTKLTDVVTQGSSNVTLDATNMLRDIEDTDMDLEALKSIVTQALSFGFDANSIVPAPSLEDTGTLAGTIN